MVVVDPRKAHASRPRLPFVGQEGRVGFLRPTRRKHVMAFGRKIIGQVVKPLVAGVTRLAPGFAASGPAQAPGVGFAQTISRRGTMTVVTVLGQATLEFLKWLAKIMATYRMCLPYPDTTKTGRRQS